MKTTACAGPGAMVVLNPVSSQSRIREEDQPTGDLAVEGGTQILWEDRWHEEEIFANRLSFYILAQSFLVAAAVSATLSTNAASRWLPVAVTIDLVGLLLTIVFWYALTENLRRLDALKEIVAEGSRELGVQASERSGPSGRRTLNAARNDACSSRSRPS